MDLETYKRALAQHDWWYDMSDDPRAYSRGSENRSWLIDIAKKGTEEHRQAWNEMQARRRRDEKQVFPEKIEFL